MKKKWIVIGLCGVAAIVLGAVALEVADARGRVIDDWSDLVTAFNHKSTTPPLPDTNPLAIYQQILAGDFSFMSDVGKKPRTPKWYRIESAETYYVSKNSKALKHLKLPLTIRIYDYLPTESIYVLSSSDGTNFTSEAAFKSEPLTNGIV